MAKRATLSPKTYWPLTGDMLENHSEGIVWEFKSNTYVDDVSGLKIRYGILLGRHPDFEVPAVKPICDQDPKGWLEGINVIHRKVRADTFVPFDFDEVAGNWKER